LSAHTPRGQDDGASERTQFMGDGFPNACAAACDHRLDEGRLSETPPDVAAVVLPTTFPSKTPSRNTVVAARIVVIVKCKHLTFGIVFHWWII
jgi:hypothetical protein